MSADRYHALESFVGGDLEATEREGSEDAATARLRPPPPGATFEVPGLGDHIGRYVALRILGRGGMGIVIAAHDPELDRQVAIKLVHPRVWQLASVEARELLRQEARAMARLVHPNVVTVHDLGTVGDQLFVAMELVAGSSFDVWLAARPRSWRQVMAIGREAGRGIAAAHHAGLVHRDIKPHNVLIDEHDQPRIADFGLAVLARGDDRPDASPAGTPAYMSPEQHRAAPVTAASDQFSFCVMLYEALFGDRPFAGKSAGAIAEEIAQRRIKPPPARTAVPASIRRALVRGLATEPDARFPTMDALLAALEIRPRGKQLAIGALVVAAAGAGAAAMLLASGDDPAAAARRAARSRAAAVWSMTAHRDVVAGLGKGGAGHSAATAQRVVGNLDRYVAGWIDTRVDVARAARAGEQAASAVEWRMACLDRRLDEVRALVAVLAGGGDKVAARAIDGVGALISPRVCVERDVTAMRPPPEEPARRARHAELLHVLADCGALFRVGKRKEAAALAETLVAGARALGDAPLLAEASVLHAISLSSSGQADRAVEVYRAAVLAAAAASDPRLEARAWVDLITLSVNAGRGRPADDVIMAATAAVARTDGDLEVSMAFDQAMAMVAITEGHPEEAERNWRRAQAAAAAGLPPDHPRQAQTRLGIATSLAEQHRYGDALAMLIEARATAERIYGPDHPDLANYWGNTFVVLSALGRYDEALAAAERVVAVAEPDTRYAGLGSMYQANALSALGRAVEATPRYQAAIDLFQRAGNHTQEFQALLNLGVDQYNRREYDAASATLERAVAVGTKIYGAGGGYLAYPTTVLGVIAAVKPEPDPALSLRRCRDGLAIGTKAWGPDDKELIMSLMCVAKAQRLTGDAAAARASAERALAIADGAPQLTNQVEARLELARVLLALRQRARARELVLEARSREADPDEDAEIDGEFAGLLK